MSGDVDYLLKVVTTDIDGYDAFYKKLIRAAQTDRCLVGLLDGADQVHDRTAAGTHQPSCGQQISMRA